MATAAEWLEGARLRTLPVAVAPILAGSGAAGAVDRFGWWQALLALVVSLALQVGVNYANDYSDGIRGADSAERVGPLRLVGSAAASPAAVKGAAFACFGVAAAAGVVLCATSSWWLLLLGVAAVLAAWFYTGGRHPYGYHALGEVGVFCFFGLAATLGTVYVQALTVTVAAVAAAIALGCLACAILVANNLRDIPTDAATGKRTLAVVLGDRGARALWVGLVAVAFLLAIALAVVRTPWALLALFALPLLGPATRLVATGVTGPRLVAALRDTGFAELAYAALLGLGLALSG